MAGAISRRSSVRARGRGRVRHVDPRRQRKRESGTRGSAAQARGSGRPRGLAAETGRPKSVTGGKRVGRSCRLGQRKEGGEVLGLRADFQGEGESFSFYFLFLFSFKTNLFQNIFKTKFKFLFKL